jgi:hypothetical protein
MSVELKKESYKEPHRGDICADLKTYRPDGAQITLKLFFLLTCRTSSAVKQKL